MLPAVTSELITYSKTCVNGDGGHLPWKWVKVWPKRKGILGNAVTWKLPEVLADENGTVPWKSLCSWRRSRPASCDSTSVHPSPEPTASAPRSLPRGTQDSLPGEHPPRTQCALPPGESPFVSPGSWVGTPTPGRLMAIKHTHWEVKQITAIEGR